jgi:hypothetical protein
MACSIDASLKSLIYHQFAYVGVDSPTRLRSEVMFTTDIPLQVVSLDYHDGLGSLLQPMVGISSVPCQSQVFSSHKS